MRVRDGSVAVVFRVFVMTRCIRPSAAMLPGAHPFLGNRWASDVLRVDLSRA